MVGELMGAFLQCLTAFLHDTAPAVAKRALTAGAVLFKRTLLRAAAQVTQPSHQACCLRVSDSVSSREGSEIQHGGVGLLTAGCVRAGAHTGARAGGAQARAGGVGGGRGVQGRGGSSGTQGAQRRGAPARRQVHGGSPHQTKRPKPCLRESGLHLGLPRGAAYGWSDGSLLVACRSIQALVLLYTEPDVAAPFSPAALQPSHQLLPGAELASEGTARLAELIAQVSTTQLMGLFFPLPSAASTVTSQLTVYVSGITHAHQGSGWPRLTEPLIWFQSRKLSYSLTYNSSAQLARLV